MLSSEWHCMSSVFICLYVSEGASSYFRKRTLVAEVCSPVSGSLQPCNVPHKTQRSVVETTQAPGPGGAGVAGVATLPDPCALGCWLAFERNGRDVAIADAQFAGRDLGGPLKVTLDIRYPLRSYDRAIYFGSGINTATKRKVSITKYMVQVHDGRRTVDVGSRQSTGARL